MDRIDRERIEELEHENQLLRTIIESIHEGVWVVNEKDEIILYNREVEKTEGMNREDVLGKKEDQVYAFSPNYNFMNDVTKKLFETGKPVIEQQYEYMLKDGRKNYIIFNAFPFFYKGKITAAYVIGRNINSIGEFISNTLEIHKKETLKQRKSSIGANFFLDDIIGISDKIIEAKLMAKKVSSHTSPVLLVGETGTGKELFAQGIHNASLFSQGKFIPVNCAAIPDTLLESMLFGTVKGAFTGAVDMPGLFEQAEGGTIFLDEINSMPSSLQAKLLRVIQDRVVRRIGSKNETPVNCRIISATNVDPFTIDNKLIIRSDLFFRLATVTINIPPLRDRIEDINILCLHFLKKYNHKFGLFINSISDELIELLKSYFWPGNIRELENVIESAMNFIEPIEKTLKQEHVPQYFKNRITNSIPNMHYQETAKNVLPNTILEIQRKMVQDSLDKNNGNISKTARELGISRQNLYYKIKIYKIDNKKTFSINNKANI